MAFDREAAKEAGYTDEEIDAFLQSKGKKEEVSQSVTIATEPPPPGAEIQSPGGGLGTAATIGAAVAPTAATLGGIGTAYGAYRLGKAAQAAGGLGQALSNIPTNIMNKFQRSTNIPGNVLQEVKGPVAPSSLAQKIPIQTVATPTSQPMPQAASAKPTMSPQAQQFLQQRAAQSVPGPVAPQPTMTQSVQRMAFDKLKQLGPRAGAAMFALTPGELGPKVPQSGPFRGMEINPQTGRPFTEQELAMYR